jgi:hypothetical protein
MDYDGSECLGCFSGIDQAKAVILTINVKGGFGQDKLSIYETEVDSVLTLGKGSLVYEEYR